MENYKIYESPRFKSMLKKFNKRNPREMTNIEKNLDVALGLLNEIPMNEIERGISSIKREFGNVFRISQRGTGAGLAQIRMYVCIIPNEKLYYLNIGKKDRQTQDINLCREIMKEIKKEEVKTNG